MPPSVAQTIPARRWFEQIGHLADGVSFIVRLPGRAANGGGVTNQVGRAVADRRAIERCLALFARVGHPHPSGIRQFRMAAIPT
jgi:hypothetical protein